MTPVDEGISIHDITVGAGNVVLIAHGPGVDLTVSGLITLGASITLEAPRDVIVEGTIDNSTNAAADITLVGDVAGIGSGGVWITATGNLIAGQKRP